VAIMALSLNSTQLILATFDIFCKNVKSIGRQISINATGLSIQQLVSSVHREHFSVRVHYYGITIEYYHFFQLIFAFLSNFK